MLKHLIYWQGIYSNKSTSNRYANSASKIVLTAAASLTATLAIAHPQLTNRASADKISTYGFNRQLEGDSIGAGDNFGYSVAVGDSYGIVGSPYDDTVGSDGGAVYAFNITSKKQIRKLTSNSGKADSLFGFSVATRGRYALIGAPYEDRLGKDSGAVYLFDLSTGKQLQKLIPDDGSAGNLFGYSVAMQGTYAAIGAPYEDKQGNDSGAVYLFDLNTGKQLQKISADDGAASNLFGYSVAMNRDYIAVGAPYQDAQGKDSGAAYLFDLNTGKQLQRIVANDGSAGNLFGYSVGMNRSYMLIGSPYDDSQGNDSGAAYLFDLIRGKQLRKFTAYNGASGNLFGYAVAVSGRYGVIGSPYDDRAGNDSGAAYLFDLIGGKQYQKFSSSNPKAGNIFGRSTAMYGKYILIGAPYDDRAGSDSGLVDLYHELK